MISYRIHSAPLAAVVILLCAVGLVSAQTPDWLPIGPFNANYGALTITPQGDIFACRGVTSEIYISTNRGDTWSSRPLPGEGALLTDLHSTLFLVSEVGRFYRSTDRATSWDTLIVDTVLATRPIRAMFPCADGTLMALLVHTGGDTLGVYRSTDGGYTWQNTAAISETIKVLGTSADGALIAFRGTAMMRSTDGGASWIETFDDLAANIASFLRAPDGHIIVGDNLGKMYRSLDSGMSWSRCGAVPDTLTVRTFGMDSTGAIWLGYLDGIRPAISTDDGASWTYRSTGYPGVPVCIGAWRNMMVLSTGTEGMLVSLDSGATWSKSYIGLPGLPMVSVVALTDTSLLAIDKSGDVYNGSWSRPAGWDRIRTRAFLALYHGHRGTIMMVIRGTAYRTTNSGRTWDTSLPGAFIQASAVEFDRDGSLVVASAGIWHTTDLGESWTQYDDQFNGSVSALAIDSSGRVFAGTPLGDLYVLDSRTSRMRKLPLNGARASINDIMATPAGTILVAIDGGGLRRSVDGGETWSDASSGLVGTHARALAVERRGRIIAATELGVFLSNDLGASWTGLPTAFSGGAYDLDVDDEGWLVAATGTGLYRTSTSISSAPALDETGGLSLKLAPNPAREHATLTLTMPRSQNIVVRLVASDGREIAVLHRGLLAEGEHRLVWSSASLADGTYFIRAESATGTATVAVVVE